MSDAGSTRSSRAERIAARVRRLQEAEAERDAKQAEAAKSAEKVNLMKREVEEEEALYLQAKLDKRQAQDAAAELEQVVSTEASWQQSQLIVVCHPRSSAKKEAPVSQEASVDSHKSLTSWSHRVPQGAGIPFHRYSEYHVEVPPEPPPLFNCACNFSPMF